MRFHLVDRIDACVPGERISARKLASGAEDLWRKDAGGDYLPEALALESLCQAGAWLVWVTSERRSRAALGGVTSVRFGQRRVRPGDELRLEARLLQWSEEAAVLSGRAEVGGELVVAADEVMCVLVEAGRFEDPETTAERERLLARD